MSLEKIANKESLTHDDIIVAAHEYADLEKQASDADAYGRQLAHDYVDQLVKEAEEKEEEEEEEEGEENGKKKEKEKTSSSNEVEAAFAVLRANGLIK